MLEVLEAGYCDGTVPLMQTSMSCNVFSVTGAVLCMSPILVVTKDMEGVDLLKPISIFLFIFSTFCYQKERPWAIPCKRQRVRSLFEK